MAYNFKYGDITNCKVRNGQTRTEYQCRLGWDYAADGNQSSSQSIESNATQVILQLEARSINSTYRTEGTGQTTIIDNTTVTSNARIDMSNTNVWQVLGQKTMWITHNPDGTLNISKSGSFTCTAGSSDYSLRSGSASVTVAPATIPRASQPTLSAGSVNIGSAVTIHMNRVSTSFTHYVYAQWASKRVEIGSNITDNVSWTLPMDFCNDIPSSPNGWGTIYVDTYSNGTYVGTKSVGFTGTVPASVVPNIGDIVLSEANSNVSPLGVLVQGKSSLNVNIATSGSYGSWITNCRVDGIDNTSYWSTQFTSAVLQQYGERTITVTVTDSRGKTATKTAKYTCIAYNNPSISVATVTRCNADGTDNEEGEYVKYSFKADVAPINNKNTYSYKLGYKTGNSGYTYITIDNSAYSLNVSNVVINDVLFSADNSYDFEFLVNDYFTNISGNPTKIERNIGTGFTLMDFRYTGKGMAIGKVSEKDALEIAMPAELNEVTNLNLKAGGSDYAYKQGEVPLLRHDGSRTILSSNNSIYLRPKGTRDTSGQIIIDSEGIIHGTTTYAETATNANYATSAGTANSIGGYSADNVMVYRGGTSDLNTATKTGCYVFYSDAINRPVSIAAWGSLIVHNDGNWVFQTAYGTFSTGGRRIAHRGYINGEWTDWSYVAEETAKSMLNNSSGNSSYIILGDLLICWGRIAITPTANTPTAKAVTFPRAFSTVPSVIPTPVTSAPYTAVRSVSISDTTTTGVNIYLTRTNTTATSIDWFAIGQA